MFAVELGFMQNFLDVDADADGADDVSTHLNVPWLAARWDIPVKDRWAFIAKVGLMVISVADADADDPIPALPFVGFGGSYAITPDLTLTVQYQGAVFIVAGAGLLSAGIGYHF